MSDSKIESAVRAQRRTRTRKGAPGLLDVAARAGVSGATVSRCYNHPDSVQPATRIRILNSAAELGYIRDRAAGTLHGRRSGTVGLVVPTIDNAIFAELIEAFSSKLQTHDRTMLIASHNYDLDQEISIIRSLLERRIDAIALVGRDHSQVALEMLSLRDIPVVTLWNSGKDDDLPSIGTDNTVAAQQVSQHLVDLGHTEIAMLFPDVEKNDRARDRKNGAWHALRSHSIEVADEWNVYCPYDISAAKAITLKLLNNGTRAPTAIICGNDVIAYGVIYACQHLGLRIPQQISVVGIGDFSHSSAVEPSLTTVRLPARRIGVMAADELVAQILEPQNLRERNVVIPTELLIRASSGVRP